MKKISEKISEKVKEIIRNKKFQKVVSIMAFGFAVLLLVMGYILDLTYAGRIKCVCAEQMIKGLKSFLMPKGVRYHIASEVIFNSMGILFTMLSLLLTVGKNLADRFEIKIFGIPRGELEVSAAHKVYIVFHKLIYISPFIMLICINLRLCVVGYLILVYNLLLLDIDYLIMSKSYQGDRNIDYTVNKLIKFFEADPKTNSEYTEYQVWLREVRLGIEKLEGWERAERLFEHFVQRVSTFENKDCYISCYLFFEVIFCKENLNEINNSALRCIKRYISELYDRNTQCWNEVVFCALMKVVFTYWNESQIQDFLKWFVDFSGRSKGGTAEKVQFTQLKQVHQINIVMVMIEEWRMRQSDYEGMLNAFLQSMWFMGDLSTDKDDLYSGLFEIVQNTEENLKYKEDNTIDAYINLQKDYIKNRGISFVGNTIR